MPSPRSGVRGSCRRHSSRSTTSSRSSRPAGGRSSSRPATRRWRRRSTSSTGSSSRAGSTSTRRRYGADRHPATDPAQAHRDAGELALLEAALERDLPTLAICRGFQLLNILRGGDLVQHLPDEVGHEGHRETLGVFSQHPVEVKEGTRLEAILGPRHPAVSSSHHQGVGRVGEGLVESAYAEDGSLEAFEDPSKQFVLGVLWHPEMEEDDKRLFEALVEEARLYRASRDDRLPGLTGLGSGDRRRHRRRADTLSTSIEVEAEDAPPVRVTRPLVRRIAVPRPRGASCADSRTPVRAAHRAGARAPPGCSRLH